MRIRGWGIMLHAISFLLRPVTSAHSRRDRSAKVHPEPVRQHFWYQPEMPSAPTLADILRGEPSAPPLDRIESSENLEKVLNSIGIRFEKNSGLITVNNGFLLESPGKNHVVDQLKKRGQEVALKLNRISVPDIKGFLTIFSQTLAYLDLSDNNIGDEEVTMLCDVLSTLMTLKSLTLSGNKIGDRGAIDLAVALGPLSRLESLDLSRNQITDVGLLVLKNDPLSSSRELNVSGNLISKKRLAFYLRKLTGQNLQE